jgi:hypothetical protein
MAPSADCEQIVRVAFQLSAPDSDMITPFPYPVPTFEGIPYIACAVGLSALPQQQILRDQMLCSVHRIYYSNMVLHFRCCSIATF